MIETDWSQQRSLQNQLENPISDHELAPKHPCQKASKIILRIIKNNLQTQRIRNHRILIHLNLLTRMSRRLPKVLTSTPKWPFRLVPHAAPLNSLHSILDSQSRPENCAESSPIPKEGKKFDRTCNTITANLSKRTNLSFRVKTTDNRRRTANKVSFWIPNHSKAQSATRQRPVW